MPLPLPRRLAAASALLLPLTALPAAAPVAATTDDSAPTCRPGCTLEPGQGAPALRLSLVWEACDASASATTCRPLDDIAAAPADAVLQVSAVTVGGRTYPLPAPLEVDDPDRLSVSTTDDLNADGFADLAIATPAGMGANEVGYWLLYDPATATLVSLSVAPEEPMGMLRPGAPPGTAHAFNRGSAVSTLTDTYQVAGTRASLTARSETVAGDGGALVAVDSVMRGGALVESKRTVVGFLDDGPDYRAFLKRAEAARQKAVAMHKPFEPKVAAKAAALLAPFLAPIDDLDSLFIDPAKAAPIVNDYGFLLTEAKRPAEAEPYLAAVVRNLPDRLVAQLNLADALYDQGRYAESGPLYEAYGDAMWAAGKPFPKRASERAGQR